VPAPPEQSSADAPVRVGVVGAGSWSALAHVPAVLEHPEAVLAGLADRDPARLAETAEHYGIEHRYGDHRELIAAGADALVVATPHRSHYAIARDALDAGMHVMVEKPFTTDAAEARDLGARAQAAGLQLVVGYTGHFSPGGIAARACVERGELGEITLLSCLYSSNMREFFRGGSTGNPLYVLDGPSAATYSDPAQAGGGQGHSQVTHAAGMLLWVTGLRPRRVTAFMSNRDIAIDVVDAIACQLDNGALATFAANGDVPAGPAEIQELRYYGTRGTMTQDLVSGRVELHPHDGPSRELAPALPEAASYPWGEPVRCLIELIRGRGENRGPAEPAIAAVELLDAAYRSAAENGRPVDVGD